MRFNCGPTWAEKAFAKEQWHQWFAWHPVRVGDECIWLETIYRKGTYHASIAEVWTWEYRATLDAIEE